jgi:hypothetical protein
MRVAGVGRDVSVGTAGGGGGRWEDVPVGEEMRAQNKSGGVEPRRRSVVASVPARYWSCQNPLKLCVTWVHVSWMELPCGL